MSRRSVRTGARRVPAARFVLVGLACLLACSAIAQAPSRPLATRTLDGRAFAVPDGLGARASLLVIGFTRDSRAATRAWAQAVARDDALRRAVDLYQVAMLEDVPSLLRRLVVAGIRRDVPASLHGRFLVVTRDTDTWKKLASPAGMEVGDACVLLLDAHGRIAWRGGAFDAVSLDALRSAVARLRDAP